MFVSYMMLPREELAEENLFCTILVRNWSVESFRLYYDV